MSGFHLFYLLVYLWGMYWQSEETAIFLCLAVLIPSLIWPQTNLWPMTKCPVFAVLDKHMNLALYIGKLRHTVYCIAIYKDLLYLSEALSNAWLLLTSVDDQQELQKHWKVCVRAERGQRLTRLIQSHFHSADIRALGTVFRYCDGALIMTGLYTEAAFLSGAQLIFSYAPVWYVGELPWSGRKDSWGCFRVWKKNKCSAIWYHSVMKCTRR